MKNPAPETSQRASNPLFVADELALDFINTHYGTGAEESECFQTDQNVLDWLKRMGVLSEFAAAPPVAKSGALVRSARDLRASALDCIERRKAGGVADVTVLNELLGAAPVHQQITWKRGQTPKLQRVRTAAGVAGVLAPVAEGIVKLLAEGDFDLVRKCESELCTLWFYDRTKSHRRRWCDMAVCGNRAKVAAFRERSKGA